MNQPIVSPFTWGANGQQISQGEMSSTDRVAKALMEQSLDFSPVGHWSQGAARVANAAVNNLIINQIEDKQRAKAGFPARPGGFLGFRAAPGSFLAGGRGNPGLF